MKRLFGGILLAVGILIAGASGLCSVAFMVGEGGGLGMVPLVLLIGGLPIALGVSMAFGGRSLIRQAKEERGNDNVSDTFK